MSDLFKLDPNEKFDEETIHLYRYRETSDEEQIRLSWLPHRSTMRSYLEPATRFKNPNSKDKLQHDFFRTNFQVVAAMAFGVFAYYQWTKTFFPYGIVLRASIPQSWPTYFKQRAPIVLFGLGAWYFTRYQTLCYGADLTNENGD